MDNERLAEVRNNISRLPGLEERLEKLCSRISEAEEEVKGLLNRFQKESLDVERLEKDSLSSTILKLIGKYGDKLNKETQEMIEAKLAYDKAVQKVVF